MTPRAVGRPPRVLLVPAGLGILVIALPLAGLITRMPWEDIGVELASEDVRTALLLSLATSLLAVGVSLAIGVPLAMLLGRARLPGRRLLRALVLMPLVLPPVVGGIALQAGLGRQTPAGRLLHSALGVTLPFTTAGAVLAEAFVAFPLVVLAAEAGLRHAGIGHEEVAATLGAGPWRRFTRVTLPLIAPSLVAGSALCWARALGEFGATITFAGSLPGSTQTVPLAAYAAFEGSGDVGRAVTLSAILLVMTVAVVVGLRDRVPGDGG